MNTVKWLTGYAMYFAIRRCTNSTAHEMSHVHEFEVSIEGYPNLRTRDEREAAHGAEKENSQFLGTIIGLGSFSPFFGRVLEEVR